jgi:hypothetical protein
MHHTRRLLIVIPLAMALLPIMPFAMTGLISIDERERTRESLQDAIGDAASEYRQRGGLQSRLEKGQTTLSEQERLLKDVEKKKVLARAEVVKLRRIRATIERRTGADLSTPRGRENSPRRRQETLYRFAAPTRRIAHTVFAVGVRRAVERCRRAVAPVPARTRGRSDGRRIRARSPCSRRK